jgi:DHA1 family tetracycline resistance protein-like MFS transporter
VGGSRGLSLGVVFLTVVINLIGFGIVLPLLPFFATDFGASPLAVGGIIGAYSAMQFVFAPIWGRISDRHGRRIPLIFGLIGTAGSYVLFALAGSIWVLLLSRIVGGVMGATIPVAQAYVADQSPREGRAKAMGLIGAAFGIGFIIGPAIGGFMSQWGYALPGFAAAGLSLLAALVAIAFLPESLQAEKRLKPGGPTPASGVRAAGEQLRALARTLGDDRFRGPIGATLLANTGIAAYTTIFPLLLDDPIGMSAAEAGAFFAFAGVVSAVTQGGLVGPVVGRLGERRTAISGTSTVVLALVVLAWAPGTGGILASLALLGVGWGLFNPSLLGILSSRADAADQGSVLGVNQSASALARVIGPAAGGWAYGALGYTIAFHAAAGLLALAALWLLALKERPPQPAVEARGS